MTVEAITTTAQLRGSLRSRGKYLPPISTERPRMIAGFTGSREGMTAAQGRRLRALLRALRIRTLHHGDCVGADAQAHAVAREEGLTVVLHPPDNPIARAFCEADSSCPEVPYLERNANIVKSCDVLLATPKDRPLDNPWHSGTWATIREAQRRKRPYYIIWPDGTIKGS